MTPPSAQARLPLSADAAPVQPARRHRFRRWSVRVAAACLLLLLLCSAATYFVTLGGQAAASDCSSAPASDMVFAGAAKADITPHEPVYLGGYGIGPVRRSTDALQPLYVRALAIRAATNQAQDTLVFAAIDSQGYFAAYQSGPYGLDDVRAVLQARLGIPATHIVISSTHSHAAPDTVGFWGGVPDAYLAQIHDATIEAITSAVAALVPARLSTGTASIAGDTSSFGEGERGGQGQGPAWPTDTQLRALHVVAASNQHTIATLLNVSVHATSLGADNTLAAPDWPGVAADELERTLGGTAIVMIGAVGHTWPGTPPGTPPASRTDAMRQYGALIASQTEQAVASASPIAAPVLCAASMRFRVADTAAPLLLGLQLLGRRGHERILRSLAAPYFVSPAVLGVEVEALRISNIIFLAAPVEPYPSLLFALRQRLHVATLFLFGLAHDDLGYAALASEYGGAVAASPTDEALFIVNPTFGDTLVQHLSDAAGRIAAV